MKILVADDSKLILSLISSLIKSLDASYEVLIATNGAEAITVAASEKPDLILMDWQMPTLSGLDALKKIKEDPATHHIPVIMLTASENTAEAFKYGATDFIQKPFQKDEFFNRIRNIMAAVQGPKDSDEEKIKNEWMNIEAEKDRLRHLKDTLIRQKKELTQIFGRAQTLHHRFFIDSPVLKSNFPNHFVVSHALLDIPSHMVWTRRIDGDKIVLAVCIFPNKGMSAFLSAFLCEKTLDTSLPRQSFDLSSFYHQALAAIKTELEAEPLFRLFLIDPVNHNLSWCGENIPACLCSTNDMIMLNDPKTTALSFAADNTLHVIQNGFIEHIEAPGSHDIFFDFLLQVRNTPFEKQQAILEEAIKNWQKELRQQNDILTLAVQLNW